MNLRPLDPPLNPRCGGRPAASDAPLVIDQPEDDLDNRFVFNGIVASLRNLKGRRQVIVSKPNANVPFSAARS